MTRVLLIRHAPTPETGKKLTGRLPGVPLGDAGRMVAEATAKRLEAVKLHAIYSSPIERTWETAEIVADLQGVPPVADEGLLEVDYGSWSGRTLASLRKLKAWSVVQHTPSRMVFPDGEGLLAAQQRGVEAMYRLAAGHRKKTVALVSHSDIIRAVVSHTLGQPLDMFQRIAIAPASVSVIDVPDTGPARVVAVNTSGDSTSWM